MRRILLSSALLLTTATLAGVGASGAFFSDTETSSGNTFTAGAIDLKVDNTSYYNGVLNPDTSWELDDLDSTIHKFFNFLDVKPGDWGEDTISLHVNTNDAYLCANVTLTSNNDNGCTTPEALVDQTCDNPGEGQGELAQNINFLWWADDGDNVLEDNEQVISQGPIGAIGAVGDSVTVPLADSDTNIWTGNPGPAPGNQTLHIGKAWCFGTLTPQPLEQDGLGTDSPRTPANSTGGISCSGEALGNETQTDSLTADVGFSAVQARNNPGFLCTGGSCDFDPELDLVADGGFEGSVVVDSHLWDIYPSPVDGWQVAWRDAGPTSFNSQTRPDLAQLELHRGVLGNAYAGDQYAELDSDWGGPGDPGTGEPASVVIYQDIVTQPGATYNLHFAFAPRPDTTADQNELGIRWGGTAVDTLGPVAGAPGAIQWTAYDYPVVATTTITRVAFTDLGTADSLGTFLDDVELKQTSCVNNI